MAYTIVEGTLKRKNEINPRLNRRIDIDTIRTTVCCTIDNGEISKNIEFKVDIFRTDDNDTINSKIIAESIIELSKYNI